ncbi:putative ABC transporter substrate binding protein [Gordonia effusa NBRC 100432]|uniref:Putative ABC transporter substrate binding protein n=1 Tax=Gordonia effusa NBRC 100432 TaxID=1077974 RepID=H0R6I3_9ACTN|nr:ABC transporter substrate-binding protein [Gordonia effusa]GAB20684.1 putative ABC transporter substrate binding protein [Gordonia effusa NBRC 100432]
MQSIPRYLKPLAAVLVAASALAGCGSAQQSGSSDRFVVIDAEELGQLNPLMGHGDSGESKIYESLYRITEGQDNRIPDATPVLADGSPTPVDGDLSHWRVKTRPGIHFSDGSLFGPADVAATYNAVIDKRFASPIAANFDFIKSVDASGPNTVDFHLTGAYADVPHRLFLSIVPAASLATPAPADQSALNDHPIGTGPYALTELRPDQMVLTARSDYWGSKPGIRTFVVRRTDDDKARAAQLIGNADGTRLPPELAKAVAKNGYRVVSAKTDDWLGITLPQADPVAGDLAIRRALNLGVDRDAMVRDILKGEGQPVSTLVTAQYGAAYDPSQDFRTAPDQAKRELDSAGWQVGADGIRAKDGRRARFDLAYYPTDLLRRDLTMATVADAKQLGIEINPVAVEKSTMTEQYITKTAFLLGGGGQPYTLDTQLYPKFHSKYAPAGVGSKWDNASRYVNPTIDRLLDSARTETDVRKRDALYREFQAEYHRDPPMLALVNENHVYVIRDNGWRPGPTALEPHTHGVAWGPWYSLPRWTR